LNAYTSREFTLYHMQSFPEGVAKSVEVLGDMLCNSVYDHYHLEMEKDTIWQELESVNQDSKETLMENVYYNCFREHMMGQPILGDIDNIREINREMVVDFHATNYFGENIVIVGTGKVSHQMLVDLAEQHFSSLPRKTSRPIKGLEKAVFNPGLLFVRDDEMINSSIGVFYDAPSWSHKDFYSFLLLQRVFGNY
jgi:predicted Zn-dependent peptidase